MSFNNRGGRGKFIFIPFAIAGFVLLLGGAVMWLWNAVLPDLVHVSRIKYWQAVGLLALCRILFGNFGKGGGPRRGGPGMMGRGGREMREKWMKMTPEERTHFKDEWRERCSNWKRRS